MGDKALSVFIGNLLLQNTTIASAAMPQIEITVANPGLGSTGTGPGNPATDLSSTLASLSRVPLTGNVERDLARIASVMPNLRFTVSSPLGNTTFILPKNFSLGDLQTIIANLTSLTDPATLANVFHTENPAASVLTLGSHSVFTTQQPRLSQADSPTSRQPLLQDARSNAPASHQGPASEARLSPSLSSDRPISAGRNSESPALAKGGVSQDSIKLPEAVRDVLVSLRILPPGVSTEQALPRLQEVVRLWTAGGAQNADLPADVVKVVSNFLASAVLATTLASTAPGATPLRACQSPELQRGLPNGLNFSGTPSFGEGARPGFQFGPLTRNDIASAVLSALSGSPTLLPSSNGAKGTLPGAAADASRNGAALPGTNASEGKAQGEKNAVGGRIVEGARGELGLDRGIRDLKSGQTRISGDEHREKGVLDEIELKEGRSAHDQESHAGAEDAVENVFDSIWPNVLDSLRREGFLDTSSDLLSLRPLRDSADGGRFMNLVASMVPQGYDPLDLLSYMAEGNRLRWAADRSEVNAALYELARYQTRRGVRKFEALLDPLRDVELLVEMADLNPTVGHGVRA